MLFRSLRSDEAVLTGSANVAGGVLVDQLNVAGLLQVGGAVTATDVTAADVRLNGVAGTPALLTAQSLGGTNSVNAVAGVLTLRQSDFNNLSLDADSSLNLLAGAFTSRITGTAQLAGPVGFAADLVN